ncbi:MAG: trypsin-like serine protease [Limimaricola sp.]|uniref:trypsin-like serine peptidase n=1 Tax=Limimaricola sp. TaxID=2211665 RepID=UPI001DACAC7E|nr:trypsin-like peptidase domain-containing protein [Limimaricola sp.]MBI1417621.1 trypsin-like serine protease [Limimaricola sp.]
MRGAIWGLVMALAGAGGATAQDSALRSFRTGDDSRGWEAVGRLDIAGTAFCTATLIAPDEVLTAAHCLFDRITGKPVDPTSIVFRAGLRDGRALAERMVRQAVPDPSYRQAARVTAENARHDLAILKLEHPIRLPSLLPFPVGSTETSGPSVGVVSYALNRAEAPSMQQTCAILGEDHGVLVLSCDVDFGSSGAPIFSMEGGVRQIVSVVSAKAEMDGKPVALGTELDAPMAAIRAQMAAETTLFGGGAPPQVRVLAPGQRGQTGARFVRPDGS